MTKEQFITLLRNPSNINLNLIKDLEEIATRFPYFQNAQILLAKQYHGHENIRYESHLRKASVYATDRRKLYNLIQMETAGISHMSVTVDEVIHTETNTLLKEPVLNDAELKLNEGHETTSGHSTPDMAHNNSQPEQPEEEEASKTLNGYSSAEQETTDPQAIIDQRLKELAIESQPPEQLIIAKTTQELETDKKITDHRLTIKATEPVIINLEDRLKAENTASETENPSMKSGNFNLKSSSTDVHTFTDWLKLKSVPVVPNENITDYNLRNISEPEKISTSKKPEDQIIENFIKTEPRIIPSKSEFYSPGNMARLSAREHEDLISETLARIYAQQGNHRKAIETYRKLSLKLPEKSAYFAALIKDLEQSNP